MPGSQIFTERVYKNLNVLVGLILGYLLAIIFTVAGVAPMVDFSGITKTVQEVGVFSLPKLVFLTSHKPIFDLGAFLTIAIVFLVSAAETLVQQAPYVPVLWIARSRWKNCRGHLL